MNAPLNADGEACVATSSNYTSELHTQSNLRAHSERLSSVLSPGTLRRTPTVRRSRPGCATA